MATKHTMVADIPGSVLSNVVTHNLNDANVKLASYTPMYPWLTTVKVSAKALNTVTLDFTSQSPAGGSKIDLKFIKGS